MNRSVLFACCLGLLVFVNANTVVLDWEDHAEQIILHKQLSYDVLCSSCAVYIMSHHDFRRFKEEKKYSYYEQYSFKHVETHVALSNIQVDQDAYFVVVNHHRHPISVTFALTYETDVPTIAPMNKHFFVIFGSVLGGAVFIISLAITAICVLKCISRRLIKRSGYASIDVPYAPYPTQTGSQENATYYTQAPMYQSSELSLNQDQAYKQLEE
jgi:hypothetical protein